jgi:HPt (histidine-containing phosphotransfer) domain-containing protein
MTADGPGAALDAAVIESLRLLNEPGQPDVVHEVLGVFMNDAPARIAAIVAAVDAHDAVALQRAAHTMKGASGAIGAFALQRACRALEEMGKQASFDSAADAVQTLHREYARVKDEINRLRGC